MSNIQRHPLIQFYLCQEPKPIAVPYLFREIVFQWDFCKLEDTHDYIQWLFPTPEMSAYNPLAPILSQEVAEYFRGEPFFLINFRGAQKVMMDFYGFNEKFEFTGLRRDLSHWLISSNHNHLRISRIIRSVRLLDGKYRAQKMSEKFSSLGSIFGVNDDTLKFWKDAAK